MSKSACSRKKPISTISTTTAKTDVLTLSSLQELILVELRSIGIEESECRAEADLVLAHATGLNLTARLMNPDRVLSDDVASKVLAILARRKEREPLQYCLGETHFFGLRFKLKAGVLIPRADTETVVQAALDQISQHDGPGIQLRIGEIGVGSGIISISLLKSMHNAEMVACDISETSIEVASANAEMHGVKDRLHLALADWRLWLAAQTEQLDGIVANPPYIARRLAKTLAPEVRLWEPDLALFGPDRDGLGFYREFAASAHGVLKPDARVFLEIGAGQSELVQDIFRKSNWRTVSSHLDLNGIVRALSFVRQTDPFENA
jgi:release factor glutamine methyltransferase